MAATVIKVLKLIHCLIFFFPFDFFAHIGSPFPKKDVPKIYIKQLLFIGTHCSKLRNFEQKESDDIGHLPSTEWVAIITWSSNFSKFCERPDHDHISVTCVKPNGYSLFVASHTYVPGYRQGMNSVNICTITISPNLSNQYQYIISKGCKSNLTVP